MKRKSVGRSISGVFVFLLLGLFAVFGTILVLLGSQAYRGIIERTAQHNETRIMSSFVRHAVRAQDSENCISVQTMDGMPVLCLKDADDDESYITYIYVHEGQLFELYGDPMDGFEPDRGEAICEGVASMSASIDGRSLKVSLTDEAGQTQETSIVLYCGEVTP